MKKTEMADTKPIRQIKKRKIIITIMLMIDLLPKLLKALFYIILIIFISDCKA